MRIAPLPSLAMILALLTAAACGSETGNSTTSTAGQDAAADDGVATDDGGGDAVAPPADAVGGADAGAPDAGSPDAGDPAASPPAPKPYPLGACPTLAAGVNKIKAGGAERSFRLVLPPNPKGAPLVFLWHGLGDTAANFVNAFGAQGMADTTGAVIVAADAVAPVASAMAIWQFPSMLAQKPPEFDLQLFDAMLTCVDGQYDIDNAKVTVAGFSAGAIWSTYLVLHRSEYLAAAAIFSGGLDPQLLFPYATPARKVPVMGTHGGPTDQFQSLLKFEPMMKALAGALANDGHTMILCAHSGGHTVTGPLVFGGWGFLFAHTWGGGASVYDAARVKSKLPAGCELQ